DGGTVAALGAGQVLRLWQGPGGKEGGRLRGEQGTFVSFAFSPDGKTLAGANNSGEIACYDWRPRGPGKERLRFKPADFKPEGPLPTFLAFLPGGDLLGASAEGGLYRWDSDGKEVRRCGKPVALLQHVVAVPPDGKTAAVAMLAEKGPGV